MPSSDSTGGDLSVTDRASRPAGATSGASLTRPRFATLPAPTTWAFIGLGALLLVGTAVLLHEGRGTTFWADEWQWITTRRTAGLGTFLDPHNEHLSLVPVVIYKLLFATVGLRHYWPYRVAATVANLVCVSLVFVYARPRVGGYFALLAATLLMFFGPGWQDTLWPFQMAWLIAIAAGLGALLLLDRRDSAGDVGASVLLLVSLASAGPGLAIATGLIVEVVQRRRCRDLWIVGAPIGLYALWWASYQQTNVSRHGLFLVPQFVFDSAAGALSTLAGLGGVDVYHDTGTFLNWGPPLLAIAVLALVWQLVRQGTIPPRVLTLLAMTLGFWVITGVGRAYVSLGSLVLISNGDASRYLYVSAVLIVLLAVEVARGSSASLAVRLVAGVLVLAAVVSNVQTLRDGATLLRTQAQLTATELGTLDMTRPTVAPSYVSNGFIFGIVTASQYFAAEKSLGSPAASSAQIATFPEYARQAADAQLIRIHQLTLNSAQPVASRGGATPPTVDAIESGTSAVRGGCVGYSPAAFTSVLGGNALQLTIPATGVLLTARGGSATVSVRRFSTQFEPLGTIASGATAVLKIAPDLAWEPWHVRIVPSARLTACSAG